MPISKEWFFDVAIPWLAQKSRAEHINSALGEGDWNWTKMCMKSFDEAAVRLKPLLSEDEYKKFETDATRLRDAVTKQDAKSRQFYGILYRTVTDLLFEKVVQCECPKREF